MRSPLVAAAAIAGLAIFAPTRASAEAPPPAAADPDARRPVELFALLGFGNAVCDKSKPDSDCPVDGGGAFGIGGAWRFHRHWAMGAELAIWSFKVRDSWRGQIGGDATDVKFSSTYLAPFARWYFVASGITDAYLQLGFGFGSLQAQASNATDSYSVTDTGTVWPLGIGAEWQLSRHFRLGPQALAYVHAASRVCETLNGTETCRGGTSDDNALPWRFVAVGTFLLGDP